MRYGGEMTVIAQRQLRNEASAILRRAEAGERFTVTVDGRPVAELSPLPSTARPVTLDALRRTLADVPADPEWLGEALAERERERENASEPWS